MTEKIREELLAFLNTMGPECCIRAMDEAVEAGAINWRYVRGVLEKKRAQGVRSIADWDRKEEEHRGASGAFSRNAAGSGGEVKDWGLKTTKL